MEDRSLRDFVEFWALDLQRRHRAGVIGLEDARAELGRVIGFATRHGLMRAETASEDRAGATISLGLDL